jgi:hypothetical protein
MTTYHQFQWDDNKSPVTMGEQITYFQWDDNRSLFFNGMTTDHFFQWDDNISPVTMGEQITYFQWDDNRSRPPIDTSEMLSSH